MAYRQGDIVLVSFPFTDLTSSKRRPALVLSPDSFNAVGEDLVLAAVTSRRRVSIPANQRQKISENRNHEVPKTQCPRQDSNLGPTA